LFVGEGATFGSAYQYSGPLAVRRLAVLVAEGETESEEEKGAKKTLRDFYFGVVFVQAARIKSMSD
jgi:hypothetical protein